MSMVETSRTLGVSNDALTRRERVVLAELAEDVTLEEIATRLFVTRNTVKSQVRSVVPQDRRVHACRGRRLGHRARRPVTSPATTARETRPSRRRPP